MCSPNVEYVLTKILIDFIEEHDTIGYDIIEEINKFDQYIEGHNTINTKDDVIKSQDKLLDFAINTWNCEGQTLYTCKLCKNSPMATREFLKIEDFLNHLQKTHHNQCIQNKQNQHNSEKKNEQLWIDELERMKNSKYKQHSEEFLNGIDEILGVDDDLNMNCTLNSFNKNTNKNECDKNSETSSDSGIDTTAACLFTESLTNDSCIVKEQKKKKKKRKSGKCDVCNRTFNDLYNLRIHKMIHTGEKPFQCEECGKRFRQFNKLKIHCITHTNEKPFKCDICDKGFRFRNYLSVHKRLHSGENPYKCKYCEEYFHSLHSRRLHTKLKHCETRTFTCTICGKYLTAQCYLTAHMKRHTNQRDFKCQTCGKCFFSQSQLKDHQLVHTNLKPYECNVCNARFQRKSNYTQHVKIHTGEKSYVCHICSKSFAQNAGLYGHMKSHAKC